MKFYEDGPNIPESLLELRDQDALCFLWRGCIHARVNAKFRGIDQACYRKISMRTKAHQLPSCLVLLVAVPLIRPQSHLMRFSDCFTRNLAVNVSMRWSLIT